MWPFRPDCLSDVFTPDELDLLLHVSGGLGTSAAFVEPTEGRDPVTYGRKPGSERAAPDPFCTFFRHGQVDGAVALRGADSACAACEAKLAGRGFAERGEEDLEEVASRRCHMGLTDFRALVRVGGRVIGALVAGRVVTSDDDRPRIRKIVGKLGKLTRAEVAGNEGMKPAIEPASEAARDRLIQEIESIPLVRPTFPDELAALAVQLGVLAGNHYRGQRLEREEVLLERARSWDLGGALTIGSLAARGRAVVEELRDVLGLQFLAVFSPDSRRAGNEATLALTLQAGLDVSTRSAPLELRWGALPSRAKGSSPADFGREAVSKTIGALVLAAGVPPELKDRVTKSVFFYPVELPSGARGAVAFGAPRSSVPADSEDYDFLARVTVAFLMRYEALGLAVADHQLRAQLERREERVGTLQREAADERARRKEVELKRNYSDFDLAKVVEAGVSRVEKKATERGVSIDGRAIGESLRFRGDRQPLVRALDEMLSFGVEKSYVSDSEGVAPLRVYLKRAVGKVTVGVEAVGEFMPHAERMGFLGLPVREPASSKRGGPRGHQPPPRASAEAADAIGVPPDDGPLRASPQADRLASVRRFARRHGGRFRLRSDRLRRSEGDSGRWLATNALLLELPLSRS